VNILPKLQEDDINSAEGENGDDSDWEVWADPSEQERRKQKRATVDSATRAQSVIGEFHAAKKAAADAKEKGDKQKQASAGRLIRELKEELASLGLHFFHISWLKYFSISWLKCFSKTQIHLEAKVC
jgi:hypothetical protein